MKRYGILFVVAVVLSVALCNLRGAIVTPARPAAAVAPESVAVTLVLTDHGVSPERIAVVKNRRVSLTIVNRRRLATGISLQGYQDVFSPGILAPGARWQGSFVADRPGDEFAWMVEGEPAGRFVVTGSHLVDNHR